MALHKPSLGASYMERTNPSLGTDDGNLTVEAWVFHRPLAGSEQRAPIEIGIPTGTRRFSHFVSRDNFKAYTFITKNAGHVEVGTDFTIPTDQWLYFRLSVRASDGKINLKYWNQSYAVVATLVTTDVRAQGIFGWGTSKNIRIASKGLLAADMDFRGRVRNVWISNSYNEDDTASLNRAKSSTFANCPAFNGANLFYPCADGNDTSELVLNETLTKVGTLDTQPDPIFEAACYPPFTAVNILDSGVGSDITALTQKQVVLTESGLGADITKIIKNPLKWNFGTWS